MQELINIYPHLGSKKSISYERDLFYQEEITRSARSEPVERYVEVIHVILFNEHGEIIIQKRSKQKNHNPNLFDKSIGGHVQTGDSPNLTAMIETIQELQTPSIVLNTVSDFSRTYEVLRGYIHTSALLQYIDTYDTLSKRRVENQIISIGNRVHTYFGIYGGRVKNIDTEAKGILYYSLDDLFAETALHPDMFTYDLSEGLVRYSGQMDDFLSRLSLKK